MISTILALQNFLVDIFTRGRSEEPWQQSDESAPGLQSGGSDTSSGPTQPGLPINPDPQVVTSTGDDDARREVPILAPSSRFFEGAAGTTVSGPAHFASSTAGNQVILNFNRFSVDPVNASEQPNPGNPVVLTLGPSTPMPSFPVDTVDVIPSSSITMSTSSGFSTETTIAGKESELELTAPKDNEIYERQLRPKGRGFALFVPEPNSRLPIAYRREGTRIGDVGIVTADGGFSYLFNICAPHDDPINPRILPQGFSPLQAPLTDVDIVEFPRFKSGSYLASASIERKENESNKGLHFETSASEGAVLTMPEGAISLDLENDIAFNNYLEANVRKWYEFVYRVRGRSVPNGQMRLVIGCDKTTSWGIATVSGVSQQKTSNLKFQALDVVNSSTTTHTWECSGMAEARVGPDRQGNEALRNRENDGHPLDDKPRNQTLFIRTMNATLSDDDWAELNGNLGKTTVKDPNPSSGASFDPSLGSRPSGSDPKSSNQLDKTPNPQGQGSQQGSPGTKSYTESGIIISTIPDSSAPYHPSDHLNQQLLQKFPGCKMVITNDQAWLSTIREDEEIISDPEELLEQVLASHDVRIENGVLRLDRKKETSDGVQKPFSSITSSPAPVSGQGHEITIHERTYNLGHLGGESEPFKITGTSNHDSDYLPGSIANNTEPSESTPGIGMVDSSEPVTTSDVSKSNPKFDMNAPQRKTHRTIPRTFRKAAKFLLELFWPLDPTETLYEQAMESYQKYQLSNNLQALQAALANFESALNARRAADAEHPQLAVTLINYASALWARYETTGRPDADLRQVIDYHEEALKIWNKLVPRPRGYPIVLTNLGNAYFEAYCSDRNGTIFQKAISTYKAVREDETFSAQIHKTALARMGITLCMRCYLEKTDDRLDEGIEYLEEALRFASASSTSDEKLRALCLANLANACEVRFQMFGQAEYLTKAIDYGYSAREFPQTSQNERISCMYNLSRLLWTRYQNTGHIKDLIDAEKITKEAWEVVVSGEMRAKIASLLQEIQTQH